MPHYQRVGDVPPKRHTQFRAPDGRGAKAGDPDARLKVLLDACVRAGLLVDDADEWCELLPRVKERGRTRTTIVLEDLDDA